MVDPRAASRAGCWSSTRSTARGRRWRGSSRPACRSRRRRLERRAGDGRRRGRLRGRDQVGRELPRGAGRGGRARRRGCRRRRAIERMLWTYGFRGRPAVPTAIVLEELIDASSVCRRDVRPRLGDLRHDPARHRPARRLRRARAADDRRGRLGAGRVRAGRPRRGPQQLPLRPRRRGADPRARRARSSPTPTARLSASGALLGSGHEFQMSCVCAANAELHRAIIESLDAGIERLRAAGPPVASAVMSERRRRAADHRLQPRARRSSTATTTGEREIQRGGGGLVTALTGLATHRDVLWVASAMTEEDARRRRGGRRAGRDRARGRHLRGRPRRLRSRGLRRLLQRHRQPAALVHPALPLGPLQRSRHPRRGEVRLGVRLQGRQRRHRRRGDAPGRGPRGAAGDVPRLPPVYGAGAGPRGASRRVPPSLRPHPLAASGRVADPAARLARGDLRRDARQRHHRLPHERLRPQLPRLLPRADGLRGRLPQGGRPPRGPRDLGPRLSAGDRRRPAAARGRHRRGRSTTSASCSPAAAST